MEHFIRLWFLSSLAASDAFQVGNLFSRLKAPRSADLRMADDKITQGKVHGEGGVYVGGYWKTLEECKSEFNIAGGSGENMPGKGEACPRSMTRHSAAKEDGSYDVVVIGAGCIGSAVARELSKTTASVLMIEAADDVSQGATKGNSGIVHAGYDDKPGSVRASLCWKGNQMFPALDEDLHFGYQLTGSLVVARGADEEAHLEELLARGATNGVENLRIVKGDELRAMEPNLSDDATAALLSPDAGTLIPYEYNIALAENAADNGVEVRIRRTVQSIRRPMSEDGTFEVTVDHWEPREYVAAEKEKEANSFLSGLFAKKGDEAPKGLGNYFGNPESGEGGPWEKFPALIKGEQKVGVAEMKVGGSGSMKAMDGVVVEKETIRAK